MLRIFEETQMRYERVVKPLGGGGESIMPLMALKFYAV